MEDFLVEDYLTVEGLSGYLKPLANTTLFFCSFPGSIVPFIDPFPFVVVLILKLQT
jgi:hypothetical protein